MMRQSQRGRCPPRLSSFFFFVTRSHSDVLVSSHITFHRAQMSHVQKKREREHTPFKRSLAASNEDRRLVRLACLPQGAPSLERVRGKCPDATRLHHRRAEKTWKGRVQDLASADCVAPSWTHSWNTEKPAAPPKPHEDITHTFTPCCAD